ncbi:PadR family transcriptional regulator [Catellatospora sp. TT07R-123]|uniref:PadR family transcriptional regulator n=1 Tax=Catellatospora sp. TT07R-123 TaxID=2733863 RepID=UPI001B1C58B6|nr:PadR family transcriptional regulator [Catellatospora sp. TT07R-123]GHJ49870.1 PadR family transcriptional regulator [Catellatospora sp. TT07R-123]
MDSERRSQWLRGVLDLCVLGLLARRESYGYELTQSLRAAGLGEIQGGTLYPVLLRLQRTGQVSADWREGGGGPARKYYLITPAGESTLRQAAADWTGFTGGVGAILGEVATR